MTGEAAMADKDELVAAAKELVAWMQSEWPDRFTLDEALEALALTLVGLTEIITQRDGTDLKAELEATADMIRDAEIIPDRLN